MKYLMRYQFFRKIHLCRTFIFLSFILFAQSAIADPIEGTIRVNTPITYDQFGSGTFFHYVTDIPSGGSSFVWAPGNNLGPDGIRAEHYNWATDRFRQELPEEQTVPGNRGHQLLARRPCLWLFREAN